MLIINIARLNTQNSLSKVLTNEEIKTDREIIPSVEIKRNQQLYENDSCISKNPNQYTEINQNSLNYNNSPQYGCTNLIIPDQFTNHNRQPLSQGNCCNSKWGYLECGHIKCAFHIQNDFYYQFRNFIEKIIVKDLDWLNSNDHSIGCYQNCYNKPCVPFSEVKEVAFSILREMNVDLRFADYFSLCFEGIPYKFEVCSRCGYIKGYYSIEICLWCNLITN